MKKAEMIEAIARETGLTKADSEKALNATFKTIANELEKGNDMAISGFGTFKISKRAARDGINPLTKEKMHIPASKVVKFKPSSALKETVNK